MIGFQDLPDVLAGSAEVIKNMGEKNLQTIFFLIFIILPPLPPPFICLYLMP